MRESENCMLIKTKLMSACAGVLLIGGIGASVASAKIVVDIRGASGDATDKSYQLTAADLNKPITLNIFVKVTGAKTGAEYLTSIGGALVSTGPTKGPIATVYTYVNPLYNPDDGWHVDGPPIFGPMIGFGDPNNDKYSYGSLYRYVKLPSPPDPMPDPPHPHRHTLILFPAMK